ncbi:MAG: cytochrome c biogenesis protein/redoxin [Pyrinomonadaceae bacterium]
MESTNITVLIAFVAGLFSFLSPCVLPLVPGYISMISGVSIDHLKGDQGSSSAARRAVIFNSIAFNIGLSLIFLSLGAAAGWIGSSIISNPWVRVIGGLVIIGFGLQIMGVLKIGTLYRDTRRLSNESPRGPLGSFVLGVAFAAGWTPCIGPILGGIIGLAATSGNWQNGLLLSAFYSAGLSLPFLLTGLGINQFLGFYSRFRRHLHKVEVVSGVLLIAIGLLIVSNRVTDLARIASRLPNPENFLAGWVERSTGKTGTAPTTATANASYSPLPEADFQTLEGAPYRLEDLRGRVVLLNFWATWCGPCRGEIPEFNAMQRDLEARGLSIVGVSTQDTAEQVRDFQSDVKQDYKLLLADNEVSTKFGNGPGLPVTYVIDRQGRIRQKLLGARSRADFEAAVTPLFDELVAAARN